MNRTRIFIGLLLLFILSCVGAVWYALRELPWGHKYAETPAPIIFNEVMGMPIPKGVTNLKVAPRHFFIKRWAKLSFKATPQAMKILLKDAEPTASAYDKYNALIGDSWVGNTRFNDEDKQKVGWSSLAIITKPEIYEFFHHKSSFIWMGYIVIDRKTGIVFVSAGGD